MVSKKKVKKKVDVFFTFLYLGKTDMVLGKNVSIFNWELGRNSAPRDGQKIPCTVKIFVHLNLCYYIYCFMKKCSTYWHQQLGNSLKTVPFGTKKVPILTIFQCVCFSP